MIKFDGMKAEESHGNKVRQLPAGPYVAQILGAKIEGRAPDQQLAVMVDVSEGPFTGFYMEKYTQAKERNTDYEVKYKGIIRLRIPNPDNKRAMYPEADLRRFNDAIYRFQQSNPGVDLYNDDGLDESRLRGLTVGISVQEDTYNGNVFTKPVRFEIADDVRNGQVKTMDPRRRDDGNPTTAPMVDQRSGMTVSQEPLPWKGNDEVPW